MENSQNNLNQKNNNKVLNNSDIIDTNDIKINELKLKLVKNQKNIDDIKLRKLATIENIQKKTYQKIAQIKIIEQEIFFNKMISVIDSLEEILLFSKTKSLQDQPVMQGIILTLKSLLNTICTFGVTIEGHKNETFNTNIHHIFATEKSSIIKPNNIISVQKKGFTFNKILLRKAVVTVSKI